MDPVNKQLTAQMDPVEHCVSPLASVGFHYTPEQSSSRLDLPGSPAENNSRPHQPVPEFAFLEVKGQGLTEELEVTSNAVAVWMEERTEMAELKAETTCAVASHSCQRVGESTCVLPGQSSLETTTLGRKAYEEYSAIMDIFSPKTLPISEEKPAENLEDRQETRVAELGNSSFWEDLDELCNDEDFVRAAESTLSEEFLESLLSSAPANLLLEDATMNQQTSSPEASPSNTEEEESQSRGNLSVALPQPQEEVALYLGLLTTPPRRRRPSFDSDHSGNAWDPAPPGDCADPADLPGALWLQGASAQEMAVCASWAHSTITVGFHQTAGSPGRRGDSSQLHYTSPVAEDLCDEERGEGTDEVADTESTSPLGHYVPLPPSPPSLGPPGSSGNGTPPLPSTSGRWCSSPSQQPADAAEGSPRYSPREDEEGRWPPAGEREEPTLPEEMPAGRSAGRERESQAEADGRPAADATLTAAPGSPKSPNRHHCKLANVGTADGSAAQTEESQNGEYMASVLTGPEEEPTDDAVGSCTLPETEWIDPYRTDEAPSAASNVDVEVPQPADGGGRALTAACTQADESEPLPAAAQHGRPEIHDEGHDPTADPGHAPGPGEEETTLPKVEERGSTPLETDERQALPNDAETQDLSPVETKLCQLYKMADRPVEADDERASPVDRGLTETSLHLLGGEFDEEEHLDAARDALTGTDRLPPRVQEEIEEGTEEGERPGPSPGPMTTARRSSTERQERRRSSVDQDLSGRRPLAPEKRKFSEECEHTSSAGRNSSSTAKRQRTICAADAAEEDTHGRTSKEEEEGQAMKTRTRQARTKPRVGQPLEDVDPGSRKSKGKTSRAKTNKRTSPELHFADYSGQSAESCSGSPFDITPSSPNITKRMKGTAKDLDTGVSERQTRHHARRRPKK